MSLADNLEKLLDAGKDSALLRFSLGNAYLQAGDPGRAVGHLRAALVFDEGYSAAWKLLGKGLAACGENDAAMDVFARGIATATAKGDKQAAREMEVFLKRLRKTPVPQEVERQAVGEEAADPCDRS